MFLKLSCKSYPFFSLSSSKNFLSNILNGNVIFFFYLCICVLSMSFQNTVFQRECVAEEQKLTAFDWEREIERERCFSDGAVVVVHQLLMM